MDNQKPTNKMKKKKIIFWTIFAIGVICLAAVGVDTVLTGNLQNVAVLYYVAFYLFIVVIGFVSVKYLLNTGKEDDETSKQKNKNRTLLIGILITLILAVQVGFRLLYSDLSTMETWRFVFFVISFCGFLFLALAGIVEWIRTNKKTTQEINIE